MKFKIVVMDYLLDMEIVEENKYNRLKSIYITKISNIHKDNDLSKLLKYEDLEVYIQRQFANNKKLKINKVPKKILRKFNIKKDI